MKKLLCVLACLLACVTTSACASTVKVTIRVIEDDTEKPVVGIPVYGSALISQTPVHSHILFKEQYDKQCIKTDQNGLAAFEMKSTYGNPGFVAHYHRDTEKKSMRDAGYYEAEGVKYKGAKEELGRWQPWNPTLTIKLKRIIKPIPMYARHVETKIPVIDRPCGYDLIMGDWIAPHGKGKTADLICQLDKKMDNEGITIGQKNEDILYDYTFSVRFSNDDDGIQSVYAKRVDTGGLRLPPTAPSAGYQAMLSQRAYRLQPGAPWYCDNQEHAPIGKQYKWDQNYFFRVRSEKKHGQFGNALYGKIHDDFIWKLDGTLEFTYYLNPTPNDRNMEFDPKKNLFGQPSGRVGADRSMDVNDP